VAYRLVQVKSVLNRHRRRDGWFLDDCSHNPYYGCAYGCIYCYIRRGKYGRNYLSIKINASTALSKGLSRHAKRRKYGFIAISSAMEAT